MIVSPQGMCSFININETGMHASKRAIPYIITIYLGKFSFIIVYLLKISLVQLIYDFCWVSIVNSYHCQDLWEADYESNFCLFNQGKRDLCKKNINLAVVYLSFGGSVDKKGESLELNTEFSMFGYHFPVILVLHFEPGVTCHVQLQWRSEGSKCYSEHFPLLQVLLTSLFLSFSLNCWLNKLNFYLII